MIKLFQFPPVWHLPNVSSFCMKVETYLRMATIPYEVVAIRNPRKSPTGKVPFIEDKGKIITDSSLIIDYLKQHYTNLDISLNALQSAQALTLQRTLEEHLYWVVVYSRWIDANHWPISEKTFFGDLRGLKRYFLPRIVRKTMWRELYNQGLARHQQNDIYHLGIQDIEAAATILNSQPFFLGDEPTSIDACAYAFLANILIPPIPSPLQGAIKRQKNIVEYCARMKERFYV